MESGAQQRSVSVLNRIALKGFLPSKGTDPRAVILTIWETAPSCSEVTWKDILIKVSVSSDRMWLQLMQLS